MAFIIALVAREKGYEKCQDAHLQPCGTKEKKTLQGSTSLGRGHR
jgi:hypothetical protein